MGLTVATGGHAQVTNICFHGIGAPARGVSSADEGYFISTELFLGVLDEVRDRPGIALSFDDGYASDVEIALPALLERGLSARFFPLAGKLGQPGDVDGGGVGELVRSGMPVGSHGMTHRTWRGMDSRQQDQELVLARQALGAVVGQQIDTAACPFGAYDRKVLAALRKHGY